jgi:hypothetical protein
MSFAEFALIFTYSAISMLSQAKSGLSFFLIFLMLVGRHPDSDYIQLAVIQRSHNPNAYTEKQEVGLLVKGYGAPQVTRI